jgi:lipoprotein-releasing system permease protein
MAESCFNECWQISLAQTFYNCGLMRRMFKPIPLFIGLRYTRAKRRNHFISFISLTSILGLALGVAVLITVLSVMNGFDRELRVRILGMVPQASLNAYEPFRNWKRVTDFALKEPGVRAAAPFNHLQGMITSGGQVSGAMVTGIEPEYEKKVSIIQNHMESGSIDALQDGGFGIVLGSALASNLGVTTGDKVTLVLPEASLSPAGVIPRFKRFTVVGVFKVGAEIDGMLAYVNLHDAGRLLRIDDHVQGVRLKFDDLFKAADISYALVAKHPQYFFATNWTETQGNLFSAIQMEKAMMALLLLFIVAVAAFNIVSSLVMVVTDKKADIAILRTLGASPNTIMKIFMVQGTLVGVVGTLSGVLLGVLLSLTISDIASGIERLFHLNLFAAYFVNYLPSQLKLSDVLWVSAIAFGLSFMATVYPARRAARVQPAEALRYE